MVSVLEREDIVDDISEIYVALTSVKETIQEKKKGMVKDYENVFLSSTPKTIKPDEIVFEQVKSWIPTNHTSTYRIYVIRED